MYQLQYNPFEFEAWLWLSALTPAQRLVSASPSSYIFLHPQQSSSLYSYSSCLLYLSSSAEIPNQILSTTGPEIPLQHRRFSSDSKDSVLQVTKRDYVTCNTSSPIQTYTGGNVNVKLDKCGPHYFISGSQGHCDKGQKLIVVVISPKHQRLSGVSPAPSPAEIEGPAVAPAPASGAARLSGGFFMALVALLVVV